MKVVFTLRDFRETTRIFSREIEVEGDALKVINKLVTSAGENDYTFDLITAHIAWEKDPNEVEEQYNLVCPMTYDGALTDAQIEEMYQSIMDDDTWGVYRE